MTTELDNYYLKQKEPFQGCLFALRSILLGVNSEIVPLRKYRIPFFNYKGLGLAFLWVYRKQVMVGIVTDRKTFQPIPNIRLKDRVETILLDPNEDIPVETITKKIQHQLLAYDAFFQGKNR